MMATKTPQETGLLKVSSSNALTKFAQNLGVTPPPKKKHHNNNNTFNSLRSVKLCASYLIKILNSIHSNGSQDSCIQLPTHAMRRAI